MIDNRPNHYSCSAENVADLNRIIVRGWYVAGWCCTKPGVVRLTIAASFGGAGVQDTVFADEALLRQAGWLRPILSAKRRRTLKKRGDLTMRVSESDGYGQYIGWLRVPARVRQS